MIQHYQEELKNFIEEAAKFFGIATMGIYGQFIVMLGTLSFVTYGEATFLSDVHSTNDVLKIFLEFINYGAKFFTMCVGAITTYKFIESIAVKITKFIKSKKYVNNSTDNK
jgi:hypothetical protein